MTRPPHLRFLAALSRARVDYTLIGVMGINHYANSPGRVYHTEDLDTLLAPSPTDVLKACRALTACGYELRSHGEPLGTVDKLLAERIVERRATINAFHRHGLAVDLVLDAPPYTFAQWKAKRKPFQVDRLKLYCGDLQMLLAAKKRAGRPKDKAFLTLYASGRRNRRKDKRP